MNQKFNVTGMTCSACSAGVERGVKKIDGVQVVNVNLLTNSMAVEYDENITGNREIIQAVVAAGYNASLFTRRAASSEAKAEKAVNPVENEMKEMRYRIVLSFAFWIPLMYLAMHHMLKEWIGLPVPEFIKAAFHGPENGISFAFTQFLLLMPIVYVNRKYFQVGFKTLAKRSPNMDSLIAMGSTAAIAYGIFAIFRIGYGLGYGDMDTVDRYLMDIYFESAGTILTLITLGKFLETRSKGKTSEAIRKLMDLAPKTAFVVRNGQEVEIPVEAVAVDDLVLIRPGQSIPVDGVIVEGSSAVDQSAITGESIPVEKQVGDQVIAATINKTGFFKFRAQKVGNDTTLARIIELVEEAGSSKAPIAKLADKISGIFVPVVICIAVAAAVIWMLLGQSFEFALSIGIAVLVISCPCALGLATPVAIMVGTGKGASNGILIKSAQALETAHTINTIVLDKTGTITEGKPKVTDIAAADGVTGRQLLEIAASIEKPSEHPLSDAIVEEANKTGIALKNVEAFTAISGKGIVAVINGCEYIAGNLALMKERKIDVGTLKNISEAFAEDGKTPLYFADARKPLGVIAVADVVKPTSREAISRFKKMGLDVVMLTGDNKRTAEAIRRQLNIDTVVAEVLPQDKESEVRRIRESGKRVAMVGDGINDAPALVRADVGIAIGAGTDIAIESADIVLMKSDLLDAVTAIQLSKATIRNIKQNLFWAFFYNTVGIPLAAGAFYSLLGWKLNPMFGAAAMSMSSVCVVSNALRLKFFKPRIMADIETNYKGSIMMKKIIKINGMNCEHCRAKAEKALNGIDGVEAKVDLGKRQAIVNLSHEVEEQAFQKALSQVGFEVASITEQFIS